jgi:hypothetical protein
VTTPQDCSVGLGVESTYGTGVTPTRWFEVVDESFNFSKNIKQSPALRVGSRVARSGRRVVASSEGSGDLTVEAATKGLGLLWRLAVGAGTSTLVSTGLYQQVFTLTDVPASATIQKGIPRADGTVSAYTFTGCMVESLTIDCPNADIVRVKTTWDIETVLTATAYAAPSYPAASSLFTFAHGAIYSGTLTAPTTTALGSATTAVAGIRSGSITLKHNLKNDRYNCGGGGLKDKPIPGLREISGTMVAEYSGTAFRDAILNDTSLTLVKTFTSGADVLQIIVPEVRLEGDLPKASTDLALMDVKWTGLDGLSAAQPIWIVARTADAAL